MAGTVVIVPARMESTRLPGKPLADICGRTLVLRVLDGASEASPDRIVVATDSEAIVKEVEQAGYEAVLTGPAANGTQRVYQAWKMLGKPGDRIVNLQGDEPGAGADWINALLSKDICSRGVSTLAAVASPDSAADPSAVKVVFDSRGRALYFSRSPIPWSGRTYFKHIGVYCFTAESLVFCAESPRGTLAASENLEQLSWMENGAYIEVIPGNWNGMGVDTPEDLEEARAWFRKY